MKTVRDHLSELSRDKLVNETLKIYGASLFTKHQENACELPVNEYTKAAKESIARLIDHLLEISIASIPDNRTCILYASARFELDIDKRWRVSMVFLDELIEDPEGCPDRRFAGVKASELLGFYVADNEFTLDRIYEVMANVLKVLYCEAIGKRSRRPAYEAIPDDVCLKLAMDIHIFAGERPGSQQLAQIWEAIYEYEHYAMLRERNILLQQLTAGQ